MVNDRLNKDFLDYLKKQISSYILRGEDFSNFLRFDMGESVFDFTPQINNFLKNMDSKLIHDYPNPDNIKIKKELSNLFDIDQNMISLGNGSDELIETIPRLFTNCEDDNVVITPTFFRFIDSLERVGTNVLRFKLSRENKYSFNDELVNDLIKFVNDNDAKTLWISNPNNPTGNEFSLDQIKRIISNVDALVIVDEALHEYIDPIHKSSAINLIKNNDNLIVLRTLSKSYGLAGTRIGFMFGSKKLISLVEEFRMPYNTSAISQQIAYIALKDQEHLKKIVENTHEQRNYFLNQIKNIRNIEVASDSKVNFVLIRHKEKDLFQELKKLKILVADFRMANGLENLNFVRIIMRSKEKLDILIDKLRNI